MYVLKEMHSNNMFCVIMKYYRFELDTHIIGF